MIKTCAFKRGALIKKEKNFIGVEILGSDKARPGPNKGPSALEREEKGAGQRSENLCPTGENVSKLARGPPSEKNFWVKRREEAGVQKNKRRRDRKPERRFSPNKHEEGRYFKKRFCPTKIPGGGEGTRTDLNMSKRTHYEGIREEKDIRSTKLRHGVKKGGGSKFKVGTGGKGED